MMLERLGIPFVTSSPEVDETPRKGESPQHLVTRLADLKAGVLARENLSAVIIGSDQLAVCNNRIIGKPGSVENAVLQLRSFSGKTVNFLTAVCVLCRETAFRHEETVVTEVRFRELSDAEIRRYIATDNPVDCAGSFKSEAAGIGLLRHMRSEDPTAIVGLPLITVANGLRKAGFAVP